jgi:hypothetical protein
MVFGKQMFDLGFGWWSGGPCKDHSIITVP